MCSASSMPVHTSLRDGAEKNIEYGEIAQLARAHGSYPWCRGFESPSRYSFKSCGSLDFTGFPHFLYSILFDDN